MEPGYKKDQYVKHLRLLDRKVFFEGAEGGGLWHGENGLAPLPFILRKEDSEKNLYTGIRNEAIDYFQKYQIDWWGDAESDGKHVSGHLMSSQVACINHLFPIRRDDTAVLAVINGIDGMPVHFTAVLPAEDDGGFIAFEKVSSRDYLGEGRLSRGAFCTSVDAFIYAVDDNGERWLIPIEWKYTESYDRNDLSTEVVKGHDKGRTRLKRYPKLIEASGQLASLPDYIGSIYFQEPFYQLMRQTLWAERTCLNKEEALFPAEHFVHIHVCPKGNSELLGKDYYQVSRQNGMEAAWREMIKDQSLYHLVDPEALMKPLKGRYDSLFRYLETRYWK